MVIASWAKSKINFICFVWGACKIIEKIWQKEHQFWTGIIIVQKKKSLILFEFWVESLDNIGFKKSMGPPNILGTMTMLANRISMMRA